MNDDEPSLALNFTVVVEGNVASEVVRSSVTS